MHCHPALGNVVNLRNLLIHLSNRLGIYNPIRDFYYKMRVNNPQRRKFLTQFFTTGSLCFDVGANIGEMTDLFRSIGVKVIAIEPQKECAAYLRKKYRCDDRVIVVEKAISSQEGLSEMYSCEANQLSTLVPGFMTALQDSQRFGELPSFEKNLVVTTTLEGIIKEYGRPDFLKVDVEGGEYEVFKSLKSRISCICFEYTFPESRQSFELCIKHLDGLGHAKYNVSNHDYKGFVFPEWSSSQKLSEFLNKESEKDSCGNVYVKYSD